MRNYFFKLLEEKFEENTDLFFLTGDTGFNLVESLFQKYPDRTLNVGVAEQNMIGIASGLAKLGYIPICYAITNFLIHRCFEQIRNDICLHDYKIILVGTSTGYDNGSLGPTHHKLDDIGAIKVFPNIKIYSPSGVNSIKLILEEALYTTDASYIRISKESFEEDHEIITPNHYIHDIGKSPLIISHGRMVKTLSAIVGNSEYSLFAMDKIKPLESELLRSIFKKHEKILVVEDNFNSGLFNSICQWVIENKEHTNIISISPKESYDKYLGDSIFLETKHGLSKKSLIKIINLK